MALLLLTGLLILLAAIGAATSGDDPCADADIVHAKSSPVPTIDLLFLALPVLQPTKSPVRRNNTSLASLLGQPRMPWIAVPASVPVSDVPKIPGVSIKKEIARTEQAIVYDATDTSTGVAVVVKQVNNDSLGQHELQMMKRVMQCLTPEGPKHVVQLLDSRRQGVDLYLVLERFDSMLQNLKPEEMTPLAVMSIALDSAKGLVEMERSGIVDDDVKPANIAFTARSGRVAHIDLGYARLTGMKPLGFTDDYSAPEIQAGRASNTSPCYGWGRTMEWLCSGRVGVGPKYRLNEVIPWVGSDFVELVARCVHPEPTRRPSVHEVSTRVYAIVSQHKKCRCCNALCFHDGGCRNCS